MGRRPTTLASTLLSPYYSLLRHNRMMSNYCLTRQLCNNEQVLKYPTEMFAASQNSAGGVVASNASGPRFKAGLVLL